MAAASEIVSRKRPCGVRRSRRIVRSRRRSGWSTTVSIAEGGGVKDKGSRTPREKRVGDPPLHPLRFLRRLLLGDDALVNLGVLEPRLPLEVALRELRDDAGEEHERDQVRERHQP